MDRAFLSLINQFGIIPTLILLIMVVWFLLREIKKEVRTITDSNESIKRDLTERIEELKTHSDEHDKEIAESVEHIRNRIGSIEREYVTREDHYKDMGGWREELREMRRTLDRFMMKESA